MNANKESTMATLTELLAARKALTDAVARTSDGADARPGTPARRAYSAALVALDVFDSAHPEACKEIERLHRERMLGGKDLLGM